MSGICQGFFFFMQQLLRLYKALFSDDFRKQFERAILKISIAGFLLHLLLIGLHQLGIVPKISEESSLLENPISAIYTPFSFILVFEVYLLVYYLPRSFTSSIAKQYEVVSLILIRKIFKDIAHIEVNNDWFTIADNQLLTVDMVSVLIIFFLISLFYRLAGSIAKKDETAEITQFINIKKGLSAVLVIILGLLSLYNLGYWIWESLQYYQGIIGHMSSVNNIFFEDLFATLILFDVLILIISFRYTENYHLLIRNSGYIISTILIRISLYGSDVAHTLLMVFSVLFGLSILWIYRHVLQKSGDRNSIG